MKQTTLLSVIILGAVVASGIIVPSATYAVPAAPSGTCLVAGTVQGISQQSVSIPVYGKTITYNTVTYYSVRLSLSSSELYEPARWGNLDECSNLSGTIRTIYPEAEYNKMPLSVGDSIRGKLTQSDDSYKSDENLSGYFLYDVNKGSRLRRVSQPVEIESTRMIRSSIRLRR